MTDDVHVRLRRSPAGWRSRRRHASCAAARHRHRLATHDHAVGAGAPAARARGRALLPCAASTRRQHCRLPIRTFSRCHCMRIFAMPEFPLRPMGLIHLTNAIESTGEMRPGQPLDIDVSARDYRRADAGLAFDMVTGDPRRRPGALAETCCFLSRWPESAQRPAGRPPRPPKAPKDAAVLAGCLCRCGPPGTMRGCPATSTRST